MNLTEAAKRIKELNAQFYAWYGPGDERPDLCRVRAEMRDLLWGFAPELCDAVLSLECIAERAEKMKGKAEGDRPFASATQACAWIAKEARGQLGVKPTTETKADVVKS